MSAPSPENDPALELIRSGNADQIAEHFYPLVRSFLRSIAHGSARELIETAAADTLLAMSRHGPAFRGRCHVHTWIYQIARRTAWRHRKREAADRARFCEFDDPDVDRAVGDRLRITPDPRAREAALEELTSRIANVDWLRVWFLSNDPNLGLNDEEIAARTGYTRGSLQVIRSRVRKRLAGCVAAVAETTERSIA